MTPQGSAALEADLRRDEGEVLRAYRDKGGVWTIGVGHTGPEVRAGLVYTPAKSAQVLAADIAKAEAGLDRYLPWWSRLDDPRQCVMANLAFNLGIHGLLGFHHFLAAMEAGEYDRAAADLMATQPWEGEVGAGRAGRLCALLRTPPS